MAAVPPAIELVGVGKRYHAREVLTDVQLTVAPGEVVGLTFNRYLADYSGPSIPMWMTLNYRAVRSVLQDVGKTLSTLPPPDKKALPDRYPLLRAIHFQVHSK